MGIIKRFSFVAAALIAYSLPALADDKKKPLTAVADLRYGAALYHYYMDRNLEALSELLVAKEKGGIQGHGDNPEIMEGGFNLAYGMERHATDIFERLLKENRPLETQNAAWFYLARLRYLRGDYSGSSQALASISPEPGNELLERIRLLEFNLALRTDKVDEAAALLNNKYVRRSDQRQYLYFNLGAAFSRTEQFMRAIPYYRKLIELDNFDKEYLTLYDKAMTAAAYSHLMSENYPAAIRYFKRVRLNSPMSSRALLGYGWAAVEMGDYGLALKPWQALANQSLVDRNSQEALVAIPFAYEKMGFAGLALQNFRNAEQAYLDEIARLDEVIGSIQGHAIREALNIDRSEDINWLNYAQENALSPQLSYLVELFSKDAFLGLVQELRDLLAIQENYREWGSKLELYWDMLDEREFNRGNEMDFLKQQKIQDKINEIKSERDRLAREIKALEENKDFLELVSIKNQKRRERVLQAEKNVALLQKGALVWGQRVMPQEELDELAETVRIQKGFLLWQAAENYEERMLRSRKALADLNEQLLGMQDNFDRIERIISQGFDLQPYRVRIRSAQDTLLIQNIDLEKAIEDAQARLRDQILAVLNQQRARLYRYLAQSRLSIARLLDVKVSKEKEAEAAASTVEDASENPQGQDAEEQTDSTESQNSQAQPAGDLDAVEQQIFDEQEAQ